MNNLEKNTKIADTMRLTYAKRKNQVCKTFKFKVDKSSLTSAQKEALKMKLVEAKWVYNYILGDNINPFDINYTDILGHEIYHLDKDQQRVNVKLQYLKSSETQGVIDVMRDNITALSKAKENGNKVGALGFITEYKSLYYKQYGLTHEIRGNKIKLQGIKKAIRVNGIKQLKQYNDIDLTCARLLFDGYDYFIALTCYINKEENNTNYKNKIIGLDLGIQTTITCSNGDKFNVKIKESERLKKLQAKLSRQQKRSNGWNKTKSLINKEYVHICNQKNDAANKIVHKLLAENELIITQDDPLDEWHKVNKVTNQNGDLVRDKKEHQTSYGVQYSVLGRVKVKLKLSGRAIFLDQWFPTTKMCTNCGNGVNITLDDRTFVCNKCGHTEDRDIHAAKNMIYFYQRFKDAGGTLDTSKLVISTNSYKELAAKLEDTTL